MPGTGTSLPQIDIVIPCYNYGRYLEGAVSSALNQTGVRTRVLIIDDCSTDDTQRVGHRLAANNTHVEYHRHDTNKGHIATYNEGLLEWARSEYSVLLSADDILAPGALARATHLMEHYPDVGMTYGMALVFGDDQPPRIEDQPIATEYRVIPGSQFLDQCFDLAYCLISAPTVVVRTSVQQKLGGYCTELPHSGDAEMWMRFGFHGSIGILRSVQAYYRWHGKNMGSRYYQQNIGDHREFWQACRYALDHWGSQHPQAGYWRDVIGRRLGEHAFWSASRAFDNNKPDECHEWLKFAEEICPELRNSSMWRRFWAKRLVGPTAWKLIGSIANKARGIEASSSASLSKTPFRFNQEVGWWPG